MRAWPLAVAVVIAARIAHGDPVPFPTIAALCAATCPADAEPDQRCDCRLIDRVDDAHAAVVLISGEDIYQRRAYALAMHDVDGWWLGKTLELDGTGHTYDPGNCCYSYAVEPIHYSVGSRRLDGFDRPVAVLRVSHDYVRASKPSWPYSPPSPVRHLGDVLICGARDGEPVACFDIELPKCADSRFTIAGDHVITECPGESWSRQTTSVTWSP